MYQILILITYFILNFKISLGLNNIPEYYNHLGTKTPYYVVANKDETPIHFEGCEASKIWMIIRHGTRLPSSNIITNMKLKLPLIRDQILKNRALTQLDENELESLRNWQVHINEEDEKILTHEGENEMIEMAERMQLRLPKLLSHIYSNTSYKFRYTASSRTEVSARYFATGLFGRATSNSVWYPKAIENDPILRFYRVCKKWKKEIKKNPNARIERTLFVKGPVVRKALQDISTRLGFKETLDFNDVQTMYLTCSFESSWMKNKPSPWCSAFTTETIQVMEYAEDLKYYWMDGYGYKLTYEQACPAIKNMAEFFQRDEIYPKAILYFTHSGTILKLLARLGLYNDTLPLKHDNYALHKNRKWNVSKIGSFGSNLATVLFKCGDTKKLSILYQERIVNIPWCSDEKLCSFDHFLQTFQNSIHECSFDEICRL